MQKSACPLIYRLLVLAACSVGSCATQILDGVFDPVAQGEIDYPFIDHTAPLGRNGPEEKFILRSTIGNTEYTMEIPGAARDYEIQVPLADLGKGQGQAGGGPTTAGSPQLTDQELRNAMPRLGNPDDRALVEGAFGVGEAQGPNQAPSYIMGIARINDLYVSQQFEYALIEINNLLTYYPSSSKLFKMKGTILVKLRSFKLAEIAWTRAAELAPEDSLLAAGLTNLRQRIKFEQEQSKLQNTSLSAAQNSSALP